MKTIKVKKMSSFAANYIADLIAAGIVVRIIIGEA